MSGESRLDLRYPIGGLFLALGVLIAGYGMMTGGNAEMYVRATSVNVNLWWGLVMLAFGAFMWGMAVRAGRRHTNAAEGSGAGPDHS